MHKIPELIKNKKLQTTGYTRFPKRIRLKIPDITKYEIEDRYGIEARLEAIKKYFPKKNIGTIQDLGGNSGFFAQSLIDEKYATKAVIYDSEFLKNIFKTGKWMAKILNIEKKIHFTKKKITFHFIKNMPASETIICMNLLHHAGNLFDKSLVKRIGFNNYLQKAIQSFRKKANKLILSLACDFNLSKKDRQQEQKKINLMLIQNGWKVLCSTNVYSLDKQFFSSKHKFQPDTTKSFQFWYICARLFNNSKFKLIKSFVKKYLPKKFLNKYYLESNKNECYLFFICVKRKQ